MTKDMTAGNPVKLILYFSIPLLIGNIFQQFYSMVDTIIVGRFLGVKALAAVGSTGSYEFFNNRIRIRSYLGFSVLVSQKFGANDVDGVKKQLKCNCSIYYYVNFNNIYKCYYIKINFALNKYTCDIIDDAQSYIVVIYGVNICYIFSII
ncbi:MATE family efflux transporter [Paraclostridium bifermentans]|nr:MATE family efflux transporter [Paraclostridium bifermentans]